ncbi:uncharacterized protein LOC131841601 [Achroia grisella]|uniref:uncharacterized protein LOC131841601 n=1 Tax=Achroia grisella TaxID=688607 RepID=UPI0027D2D1FC|nr:uncharacterized protein LOC131841601 [Achroia grisella]
MTKLSVTVLLAILLTIEAGPVVTRESLRRQEFQGTKCSELLTLNGVYAFVEQLTNVTGIPADMRVHWKTGNIFYTLISNEMKMSLQILRTSGEVDTIKVAGLGQSTSVDNLNDIVYLATDNGVYKYKDDGSIELSTALGEDVMYVAVTNDGTAMYIATWPQNRVHKINNETQSLEIFSPISNGHGLTIDTRNNIFFVDIATEILYVLKNGETVPIKIKEVRSDKMINVFVSRSDDVYAMDGNSNYYHIDVDNETAKFVRNFNLTGVNTFAMDSSDNILIGVKGAIFKYYIYDKNPCNEVPM